MPQILGYTGRYLKYTLFKKIDIEDEKAIFGEAYQSWLDPIFRILTLLTDPGLLVLTAIGFSLGSFGLSIQSYARAHKPKEVAEIKEGLSFTISGALNAAGGVGSATVVNAADLLVGGCNTFFKPDAGSNNGGAALSPNLTTNNKAPR
ncbi:MAG: hypothetical protein QNK11_06620 [Legionella sp.]|nr:hypothetical protein [Legionella sp.]